MVQNFCPNCGAELHYKEAEICPECGVRIKAAPKEIYPYAGFWIRFVAAFIDGIILTIVEYAILFFLIFATDVSYSGNLFYPQYNYQYYGGMFVFWILISILISWVYYAYQESSPKQATIGKQAVGIVVTDLEFHQITFGKATGRFFAKILSVIVLFIGYVMIGFTEKKQGLHDMLVGTYVVYQNKI
ncbi:MAG: RDD family protein [Calditrichaeota bacterium]|nr:RDD family protein [Calditrichota bacterium]